MDGAGILINTFESLESMMVEVLRDPRCIHGRALSLILCGPTGRRRQHWRLSGSRESRC
jgi:hypothetical protein